jgi:hypothetical protein
MSSFFTGGATLPSKFPFWSAIITQTGATVSVASSSTVNVDVQPPSGETWLLQILFGARSHADGTGIVPIYSHYDGTTATPHASGRGGSFSALSVERILTNTLYARLQLYNISTTSTYYGAYGYSGFKLSQPQWSPVKESNSKPYKKATDLPLPAPIKPLEKYKAEILGLDPSKPDDYCLAIILEEDTVLARDPITGFPVERMSAYVPADTLADLITQFKRGKSSPDITGYTKYIMKWKNEGIDLGI